MSENIRFKKCVLDIEENNEYAFEDKNPDTAYVDYDKIVFEIGWTFEIDELIKQKYPIENWLKNGICEKLVDPSIVKAVWFFYEKKISIIPLGVNKDNDLKRPSIPKWTSFQNIRADKNQLQQWLDNGLFKNIGVICGKVSGNLVIIDVDDETIPDTIGLKLDKIAETGAWVVKTGKGYHIYCRHNDDPGGIKRPIKYKIESVSYTHLRAHET